MGRLSCLPSYPWPFHSASQVPCSNTRGLEDSPWQGSPCPALRTTWKRSIWLLVRLRLRDKAKFWECKSAIIIILLYRTPTASRRLQHCLAGRAALPGSLCCQRAPRLCSLCSISLLQLKTPAPAGRIPETPEDSGIPARIRLSLAPGAGQQPAWGQGSVSGELFKNELVFTALRRSEELASRC